MGLLVDSKGLKHTSVSSGSKISPEVGTEIIYISVILS